MAKKKQKLAPISQKKQWLIAAGLVVVLFVFAFVVYAADYILESGSAPGKAAATTVTISGNVVCLPNKDTTGPVTMECAAGVKTTDGKYYGVADKDLTAYIGTSKKVTVTGMLQQDPGSKYDTVGTLRAYNK